MYVAFQTSDRARTNIDTTGIHIRARNVSNTMMIWIDVPATVLGAGCPLEHFPDELGINTEKLYRMLNAYEAAATIEVYFVQGVGEESQIKISGTDGTLWTYDVSTYEALLPIPTSSAPLQAHHPPVVSGVTCADHFRGWLRRIEANETAIPFRYEKGSGKFPIKTVSEHCGLLSEILVLSYPEFPDGTDSIQTIIDGDLLQDAIAPSCIDDDIKFAFGDDTPIYISTKVNGCDVAIAIAPRIEIAHEIQRQVE